MASAATLATLALTSRLTPANVKPLSAREFWPMSRRTDVGQLPGRTAAGLAETCGVTLPEAERIGQLLERGTAIALSIERIELSGIWTLTGLDDGYPERLSERLGDASPPVLHGVGDPGLLSRDGLGIVGSRNVTREGAGVARAAATAAANLKVSVVSGAARGVDQEAMNAAFEAGGGVIGVLADALLSAVARPATRKAIAAGQICLVTPYAPSSPFTAGNAMGRNKIIYGLSRRVLVVASEEGSGGTWSGAVEALRGDWTTVLSWTGPGSARGNAALVRKGAVAIEDLSQMFAPTLPPDGQNGNLAKSRSAHMDQLTLEI
jgi:predicted Rossmann fold nucleotide-binding protein DprA/Smf involved in DNA uptake